MLGHFSIPFGNRTALVGYGRYALKLEPLYGQGGRRQILNGGGGGLDDLLGGPRMWTFRD